MDILKKRIEFDRIKVFKSKIETNTPNPVPNPDDSGTLPGLSVNFRLLGSPLNGYGPQYAATVTDELGNTHPQMGGWPEMAVGFNVTETDLPRVNAWFDDNYHNITAPESATLIKNRQAAVVNALKSYIASANNANLFTSPLRLGWCMKLTDGTLSPLKDCGISYTFLRAPLLPIISNSLSDKTLHTRCQLRNIPARLHVRISPDDNLADFSEIVESIEIFATAQTDTFADSANVAGVRSITVDGYPLRCWQYDRYEDTEVLLKTEESTPFRKIGSIPVADISNYSEFSALEMAAGTLSQFSSRPSYESLAAGTSTGSDDPDEDTTGMTRFLTEYLHLDYPENEKSIRGLTVRGVFDRSQIRVRLYGSQHREKRLLLASARSAYIRGLTNLRLRWLQVEIECNMREGDFIEALTFDFSV